MSKEKKDLAPESVVDTRTPKQIAQQGWNDLEQEEKRIVRGKFIYHECPNGIMEFSFRKFKGEPLTKYSLKDGEIYSIPLSVARHLNNNCWYPSYTYKNDEAGRPTTTIGERIRRAAFQSLDFY